jgi:ribosomal protein S18 acetylase RimI-like enzyme
MIRAAVLADERQLAALDRATWSWDVAPVPLWPEEADFFARDAPADVLVAEQDGAVVGYVKLRRPTELESHRHVLQIGGLAVDPACHRHGIGRRLIDAAVAEATRRGARRLSLHVLGRNHAARGLYAACDFVVEGVLRDEFWLDGRYVDDVLMARSLEPGQPSGEVRAE